MIGPLSWNYVSLFKVFSPVTLSPTFQHRLCHAPLVPTCFNKIITHTYKLQKWIVLSKNTSTLLTALHRAHYDWFRVADQRNEFWKEGRSASPWDSCLCGCGVQPTKSWKGRPSPMHLDDLCRLSCGPGEACPHTSWCTSISLCLHGANHSSNLSPLQQDSSLELEGRGRWDWYLHDLSFHWCGLQSYLLALFIFFQNCLCSRQSSSRGPGRNTRVCQGEVWTWMGYMLAPYATCILDEIVGREKVRLYMPPLPTLASGFLC